MEDLKELLEKELEWPIRVQNGLFTITFDVKKQHKIGYLIKDEDTYKLSPILLEKYDLKDLELSFIATEDSTIAQYNTRGNVLHSPEGDKPSKIIFDHSTSKFSKHWHTHGVYYRENAKPNYIMGEGLEVKIEEENTPDESIVETTKQLRYRWITRHYRLDVKAPVEIKVENQTRISDPKTKLTKYFEVSKYHAEWTVLRSDTLRINRIDIDNLSEVYDNGILQNRQADMLNIEWINRDNYFIVSEINSMIRNQYLNELNLWETFPVMNPELEIICTSMMKNELNQ